MSWCRVAMGSVVFAFGCGGEGAGGPDAQQEPVAQWVVSSWQATDVSADAEAFAMDVDGDGRLDNAAGLVISMLAHDGITENPLPYDRIDAGETITLLDLRAAAGGDAALWVTPGGAPDPAPCAGPDDETCAGHLDGSGRFALDGEPAALAGQLEDGGARVGPGPVELVLPLFDGVEPLRLPVVAARVAIDDVGGSTIRGVLGGAITEEYVYETLEPALVEATNAAIAADCPATEPPCCTEGSTGDTLIELFDEDDDCRLSREELHANPTVDSVLIPDLDLFDESGAFNPGVDGVRDSVSLGARFEAVPASFPPP